MFDQMCKVIEVGGVMPKRRRVSSTEKEIEIEEKEVAQEIQVVHKGDTVCEECGVDYKSTTTLNGHVMKCHKGDLDMSVLYVERDTWSLKVSQDI